MATFMTSLTSSPALESAKHYHQQRHARLLQQREALRLSWLARAKAAIESLAPEYPAIQRVALFGSVLKAGRFHAGSDIDVAVICQDVEQESRFWRALEEKLRRDVDVRPWVVPITQAVEQYGAIIYG
jgi:predicted nucleotidyltransferase